MISSSLLILPFIAAHASAHVVAWTDGMYCRGGNVSGHDDPNTNTAVNPLWMLPQEDWWFQHDRGCDAVPPSSGQFLHLPANGNFTVELAHNRGQTTLSHPDGSGLSDWPDGLQHPDNWSAAPGQECLSDGAMHASNQSTTAGTAFAISYVSELSEVTMENLVVFSTLSHTPWKRLATYEVPDLPACPPGGCTCAWLWVPDGCGEPNMYMAGYKCTVDGATSTKEVGTAKPPTFCAGNQGACQAGPKQMIAWNQQSGNNVQVPNGQSPGYNMNMGYKDGAQTDIFV